MSWTAPLDFYCERLGPSFWAEPLNALTNAAFLIAAVVILNRQRRSAWADRPVTALALLVAVIGVGSFLFHTFANRWSNMADVLPIRVFIYAYFFLAMRRFLRLNAIGAGLATAAFLLLSLGIVALLRPVLGSSAAYAPALLATFGVAAAMPALGRGRMPLLLVGAGLVFTLSLAFRMLDLAVCGTWTTGTHFLWHVLNAVALALLLLAAERAGPKAIRSTA